MRHVYFYHYTGMMRVGRFFASDLPFLGNGEAQLSGPITSLAGVMALEAHVREEVLRRNPRATIHYLTIDNFLLLRTEPDEGPPPTA